MFETFQGLHYSFFCCNSQCRGIYLVLLLRRYMLSRSFTCHTLHLFFSPHQLILGQRTFDESINKEGKFYFDTLLYSPSHTCDNYSIPGSLYSYNKEKLICDSAEAYINIVLNNFQNSSHLPLCFIYIESQLPTRRQQYSQCNLFHDRIHSFFCCCLHHFLYSLQDGKKSIFLGYYYYFYRIFVK